MSAEPPSPIFSPRDPRIAHAPPQPCRHTVQSSCALNFVPSGEGLPCADGCFGTGRSKPQRQDVDNPLLTVVNRHCKRRRGSPLKHTHACQDSSTECLLRPVLNDRQTARWQLLDDVTYLK